MWVCGLDVVYTVVQTVIEETMTHDLNELIVETDVKRTSLFSVLARSLHEINYWDICQPKTK